MRSSAARSFRSIGLRDTGEQDSSPVYAARGNDVAFAVTPSLPFPGEG